MAITNFLDDTLEAIHSWDIDGKQLSENDVIAVEVGGKFVTWECFKESAKDITWDSDWGENYIRTDIAIYTSRVILYLHEYDSQITWAGISIPKDNTPDTSITSINLRPKDYKEGEKKCSIFGIR